jgi:hypothetical protein
LLYLMDLLFVGLHACIIIVGMWFIMNLIK